MPLWMQRRNHRWKHLGHIGHVRMMEVQLQNIINSDSTSNAAKDEAAAMLRLAGTLKRELERKMRVPQHLKEADKNLTPA